MDVGLSPRFLIVPLIPFLKGYDGITNHVNCPVRLSVSDAAFESYDMCCS
jgi:hypothetical protein